MEISRLLTVDLNDTSFLIGISIFVSNIILLPIISFGFFALKEKQKRDEKQFNRLHKKVLPVVTEIVFLENYERLKELKKLVGTSDLGCDVLASCFTTMALNFKGEETEKLRYLFRESGLLEQRERQYRKSFEIAHFRQLLLFGAADEPENMIKLFEMADQDSKKELLLYVLGKGDVRQFWSLNEHLNSLTEWDQLLVIERLFRRTGLKIFHEQFPIHLKDERSKLFVLRLIRRFNLVQHHPLLIFFLSDSVKVESEVISICEQFPTDENLGILKAMFPCKDPTNNHRIQRLLRSYGEKEDITDLGKRLTEWQTIQFSFAPPFMN